jgi:hypothetical protein
MADRPMDPLVTLQHVLASAAKLAQELVGDHLMARFLDIFGRIPVEDRETIVNVIEREVDLRNLSRSAPSGPLSGVTVTRPNPNARLYLRVTDNEPAPYVAPVEIVQAVIRAARIMHRAVARGADLSQIWEPAMIEGLTLISPEERETIRWYHRAVLEVLDRVERA